MNDTTVTVTGTVNAGVCLSFPEQPKIWIDFYAGIKTPAFSYMTDMEWDRAKQDPALFPPDLVLFTHTHPDHFCALRTKELHELCPGVPVYFPKGSVWKTQTDSNLPLPAPEDLSRVHLLSGSAVSLKSGEVEIEAVSTVHSGAQFVDVPHYSYLIRYQGKQVFISGDALVTADVLTEYLEEHRIDLAILTFPWASTSVGRERIEFSVQPSHLLLYHIPKEGEDPFCFRPAACSGASLVRVPDVRLFTEPFMKEVFHL